MSAEIDTLYNSLFIGTTLIIKIENDGELNSLRANLSRYKSKQDQVLSSLTDGQIDTRILSIKRCEKLRSKQKEFPANYELKFTDALRKSYVIVKSIEALEDEDVIEQVDKELAAIFNSGD